MSSVSGVSGRGHVLGAWPTCDSSHVGGGRGFALAIEEAAVSDAVRHGGCDPVLPPGEPVLVGSLSAGQNFHLLHNTPVQLDPQTQRDLLRSGRGSVRGRTCSSSLDRFVDGSLGALLLSSIRSWSHSWTGLTGLTVRLRGACSSRSGLLGFTGSGSRCLDAGVIPDLWDDSFLGPVCCCGLVCVLILHFHVYIRTETGLQIKTLKTF